MGEEEREWGLREEGRVGTGMREGCGLRVEGRSGNRGKRGGDEMSCCSGHAWERCEGEGLVTREDIGIARGEPVRVG